jgi:metal-responsive CopG/Arc/MetJ family transcriptional regulator
VKHETRNITLALPEPLLRRFRVYAASRHQSMSSLMTDAVKKMIDEESEYERSRKSFLDQIHNPAGIELPDKIPWSRDELHER